MTHLSQKHLKEATSIAHRFESRRGTAVFERLKSQLTKSLRELCAKRGSINVVCRDLDINRQQFAKYLSGTNLPSTYIIQRLAIYFSVDPSVFFIDTQRRHRFMTNGALQLEVDAGLAEGFYLEHSLSTSDSLAIGLWRFERQDEKVFCHGELPRHREGRQVVFDSFDGQIVSRCAQQQLIAISQGGGNSVVLVLKPFELGGSDMLAIRTAYLEKEDVLESTPSMLRYIGPQVDIAKSLTTQCGIIKLSELDERKSQIVELLSKRVAFHGCGFRVTP